MKVEAADDLQGRMIRCEQREKMIGAALVALAHSEVEDPDPDTLDALGQVAFELAEASARRAFELATWGGHRRREQPAGDAKPCSGSEPTTRGVAVSWQLPVLSHRCAIGIHDCIDLLRVSRIHAAP